ncbi:tetratricopeptide repeat protein [Hymenobacter latericus]|uniref:tetratricopeptide repeat protein n=1 Tax=Hymenobacter sp. YIM 151858-1 TaxID=2987688 RepID=UPI002226618C|nr:tetratricopeptide repeat protein [Hymenobacter sp. YIM 151858-1]UYZ58763.1 tetratricopeptide repeat protein [Hymenobacter sp. YIM 151858-1]
MANGRSSFSPQLLILILAAAVVVGLFLLPKGVVKPKEGKGEAARDAAATSSPNGGGPNTNGSKTEASSGPVPASQGVTAQQPHTMASAEQRKGLNTLVARYRSAQGAAKLTVATDLAKQYQSVQRFDSAGYYYEQVAQAKPGEQAWKRAADQYFEAYSFAATEERAKMLGGKARELYEKVLKQNPQNLDAKTNLGMALMASENPVQGIMMLREVLAADPKNEKALYNLGILALQSNQPDKAVERFQELVKVNPKNVNGMFYLGVSLAQSGKKEDARQTFLKVKSLSNDPGLLTSVNEELQKL